jgi:hypothetical protein
MYRENVRSNNKCALDKPHLISDFRMNILVNFLPNASGIVGAKNLHKWAEKAFASVLLVFHDLLHVFFAKKKQNFDCNSNKHCFLRLSRP